MSGAEIAAVKDGSWRDLDAFSAEETLALEYAELLTATPPTVDQALVERLSNHFDPGQIVEMSAIVAWENYRARFNCGLGVEAHGFYNGADQD